MSVSESNNFSKPFSSFRHNSTKGPKFSRKMFSSFRVKSSTKPLLRNFSFRTKSYSKITESNQSDQQWIVNPLYVSVNQGIWQYSTNDIEQRQSCSVIKNESDLVKQSSISSGVSSESSGIYSHSSKCSNSLGISSSGVSSAIADVSSELIGSTNSELFDIPNPKTFSYLNDTYKSTKCGALYTIDNKSETISSTIPPTPTVPFTYGKLRLVRRIISENSHSDADYVIQIDEYYNNNSELLSGSSSGISSDDNANPDNSYQDFYNDLVEDIKMLLIVGEPHFKDSVKIGFLESIH